MKIRHLNCGSFCPRAPRLVVGPGHDYMPCHCLLIETSAGLVLVDTGLGLKDIEQGSRRIGRAFTAVGRPRLLESECAIRQIEDLGYSPNDVRHILVTHLDLDHAGGLSDFPQARVHVYGAEYRAATGQSHPRYVPAQFSENEDWRLYDDLGERWFGFETVRALDGLPDDILMIPTVGHTAGHAAIAVKGEDKWVLHCGDAYFHRGTVRPGEGPVPRLLGFFERTVQVDGKARLHNQERLRNLVAQHGRDVDVFCSHDPVEFERRTR